MTVNPKKNAQHDTPSFLLRELEDDGVDVFESHPQLLSIWPTTLLELAREGFVEFGRCPGGRFLIESEDRIVGITGYFWVKNDPGHLRQRWHGLVPEARGRGLSGAVMREAARRGRERFPSAHRLIESMPAGTMGAEIARHYESLGFSKFDPPERGGQAGLDWQSYAVDLDHFLIHAASLGHTSKASSSHQHLNQAPR